MDFLDPAKKRANGIKLFVGYLLVAVAIGLAALVLIYLSYGYSLDRSTGTLIQNGIVFVNSNPDNAEIVLNGKSYKDPTDTRAVLPSLDYKIEIKKDGYRSWQNQFFLAGGEVLRFAYPRLFPIELKSTDAETYKTMPSLSTQSPDKRWLLVQKTAKDVRFELFDLEQEAPVAGQVAVPKNLLSAGTRSFSVVEWANDNRRVLLRHNYAKGHEFIVLDRERPNESLNINQLTKATFSSATLRDKKYDTWHLHDAKSQNLSFASRESPTPELLIADVLAYKSYGTDIVLYATTAQAKKGMTNINIRDKNQTDTLRSVVSGKRYLLDVARFDNNWYFVAGSSDGGKVYVYRDPFDVLRSNDPKKQLIPVTTMRLEGAEFVSFSQNTRFISAQAGSEFAVYDAEVKKSYRYDTKLKLAAGVKAAWMDGHRFSTVVDNDIVVFDFDGTNLQRLVKSSPSHAAYFTGNYERLFAIAPKANSAEANLTNTRLIVD
jgi:hypothetical protein